MYLVKERTAKLSTLRDYISLRFHVTTTVSSSKLDKSNIRRQKSDQVRLVKSREVKTRDDAVNLAQDAQACSGELLMQLR